MGQQISARGDPALAGEPLSHPKGMTEARWGSVNPTRQGSRSARPQPPRPESKAYHRIYMTVQKKLSVLDPGRAEREPYQRRICVICEICG